MEKQSESVSSVFERFEAHDFLKDEEFQSGLASILASNPRTSPELISLARIYYYSKTVEPIDHDEYLAWKHTVQRRTGAESEGALIQEDLTTNKPEPSFIEHTEATPATASQPEVLDADNVMPYPASFADIVELIRSGKPIPGIKTIPDKTAEGEESTSTLPQRAKPWDDPTSVSQVSFFD